MENFNNKLKNILLKLEQEIESEIESEKNKSYLLYNININIVKDNNILLRVWTGNLNIKRYYKKIKEIAKTYNIVLYIFPDEKVYIEDKIDYKKSIWNTTMCCHTF